MIKPIYLDYASTTPVAEEVAAEMSRYLTKDSCFGNPASRSHMFGWEAEKAIVAARAQVAQLINADPREIIFTSGATESNNLAIKGLAEFLKERGKHIITVTTEHKAVLDPCRQLERDGFEITYLNVAADGMLDPAQVSEHIRPDTILISVMHVNNEIGVVQDITEIGRIAREKKVYFHVDAAQSFGKLPIDVRTANVDLLSISGHKIYGPKGIGALFISRKPRVRLSAQIHGGGHERGMRSGTLPTHQIAALGKAAELAAEKMDSEHERLTQMRRAFIDELKDIPEIYLNGSEKSFYPGIVNISFAFIEGESLLMALKNIALSSGSACTSASLEPSYVLRALGLEDELAHSSLRFSMGRYTTAADLTRTASEVRAAVSKLRDLSPLWDMHKQGIDLKTIQWASH
ncbi:MAG: IscS subfamily cysteine desulfurase [Gammaproteobacteria bacterium]|nr:IscS subfamily cysteine desulfurase [Pseudomonadota bacterium]MCH9662105.1 IscS subfamily cysteine desulfurase [Gammaproteobacteria bacterium]